MPALCIAWELTTKGLPIGSKGGISVSPTFTANSLNRFWPDRRIWSCKSQGDETLINPHQREFRHLDSWRASRARRAHEIRFVLPALFFLWSSRTRLPTHLVKTLRHRTWPRSAGGARGHLRVHGGNGAWIVAAGSATCQIAKPFLFTPRTDYRFLGNCNRADHWAGQSVCLAPDRT